MPPMPRSPPDRLSLCCAAEAPAVTIRSKKDESRKMLTVQWHGTKVCVCVRVVVCGQYKGCGVGARFRCVCTCSETALPMPALTDTPPPACRTCAWWRRPCLWRPTLRTSSCASPPPPSAAQTCTCTQASCVSRPGEAAVPLQRPHTRHATPRLAPAPRRVDAGHEEA